MRLRIGTPGPSSPRRWKGKERRRSDVLGKRDVEGSGGADGLVLPLDMVDTGAYDVAYTVPIQVGTDQQNMSLQVDTGSADLWVASTSCSTSACSDMNGRLYNPGQSATSTGSNFNITYLRGNVLGPIVWDEVQIGGYSIDNQALAAATTVNSEPLSYDFDGILGLALPLFSVISQIIPPVTNNNPDGASFSSNLFGITPISQAPSAHFFSLVLQRPGSSRLPSLLGIGRHPSSIVPDPSKIGYSELVTDEQGTLLWKTAIRAITVYVNSVPKPVTLPSGIQGMPFPVAVLDSGVPLIITTSDIANGIYGALGIGPAADGQYYVPCTTPLNMTITLDDRSEISIHPLDLTSEPLDNPNAQTCVGLIQTADSTLESSSVIGDMILGVPFMRNTYTVLSYQIPDSDGDFVNDTNPNDAFPNPQIHPRLGLMGLTNSTIAMQEFHTVRVLNQPLESGQTGGSSGSSSLSSGKKMSVGIDVLLGLVGFFGLCVILFALRWFLSRRKWNRAAATAAAAAASTGDTKDGAGMAGYQLTRQPSRSSMYDPSNATLRTMGSNESRKKDRILSEYTMSSGRTHVDDRDGGEFDGGELMPLGGGGSGGTRSSRREDVHDVNDPWDPRNYSMAFRDSIFENDEVHTTPPPRTPESVVAVTGTEVPSSSLPRPPDHQRTTSELRNTPQAVLVPLLTAHTRSESKAGAEDLTEFGLGSWNMVGVGTAARGSKIDTGLRQHYYHHHNASSVGSDGTSARAPSPPPRQRPLLPRQSSTSPNGPRHRSRSSVSGRSISNSILSDVEDGPMTP